ncbi:hypothetical protein [Humisphaera borealis]|uniref:Uncharacterized protein n=1 Tax=Humisphaera borealis TaxID=2807512 RepID=A0A7M2WVH4_9BACT|nr:hypothetical protein [Humisphaera borealis]QOV89232.1 hypothetical protein IPV69_23965 [Humisphaera borealis]
MTSSLSKENHLLERFGVTVCRNVDQPGVGIDVGYLVDFSQMPVCTPDQQRIEAVLQSRDLTNRDLLHVGIGNSHLAMRLSPRCRLIDGITVAEAERQRGRATGLANYRALKANKYAVSLAAILNRHYDHIIDNNLASFACCGFHLMLMMSSYRLMLRHGGSILTDRQGMEWTVSDPRWKLTEPDLGALANALGLKLSKTTEWVYELTRPVES